MRTIQGVSDIDTKQASFLLGAKHAAAEPAIILFLALISFGVTASDAGFSSAEALLSTALLWALPAQLAHAESIAVGSGIIASVAAIVLTNLRFFPMIISLLPQLSLNKAALPTVGVSHFVTATSWAWCMDRLDRLPKTLRAPYFFGFSICCWLLGIAGTATGLILADSLPPLVKLLVLYIAPLYMLLLLAGVRGHRLVALIVGAGAGLVLFLFGNTWYLPIAAIVGGSAGFIARRPE